MLREIGSNFWFSPEETKGSSILPSPSTFGCEGSDYVWMSTGRSATRLVLETIIERNPTLTRKALIPSFTCHTVIEPFIEFGFEVIPLPINEELKTSPNEIISLQRQTNASVVLAHHYFGFITTPHLMGVIEELNNQGVILIEDRTQCLYSSFPLSSADYYVGSIRKWCGVPDGGFAVCREGTFRNKPTQTDELMVSIKKEASELKYRFIYNGEGEKSVYKKMYSEAEALLDSQDQFYSIGKLSCIIQAGLDIDELKTKRRKNFSRLMVGIKDIHKIKPVFDSLPEGVTPLYFPVLLEDRKSFQSQLAENDVYAPVVWPKAECCPPVSKEADYIYKHILCIPIDQRYGIDDMEHIISVINNEC